MIAQKLLVLLTFAAVTLPLHAHAGDPIEPNAGNWRTSMAHSDLCQ